MALINESKPSTSLANATKVSFAELWSTITTTYATETRTWADCISLMDNISISTNPIWSSRSFPWLMALPWQQTGGVTNVNKP